MNNLRIVYFIKAIFWINNFKLLYNSYIVIVIYFIKNNKIVNKLHINKNTYIYIFNKVFCSFKIIKYELFI